MPEELGSLGIWEQRTDYTISEGNIDTLPQLFKKDEIRYEYNQWANEWSKNSCTIFAAVGMASDLTNYKFSLKEIKEIDEMSYARGRIRGNGWYVQSAVKLVADWWNANEELSKKYWKLAYYRISKYDDEVIEWVIDKLYTIDWNYCPTNDYNIDRADWMIDGTNFGTKVNWHSVDVICKEWQRSVKDSYYGRNYNIYWLKNKLSQISNYGSYFYVYTLVSEDNLEELKRLNEMKTLTENMIADNSAMRHLTNDEVYRKKLHSMNNVHRQKIADIEQQLKKYL